MNTTVNDKANALHDELTAKIEAIADAAAVTTDEDVLDALYEQRQLTYARLRAIVYICEGCGAKLGSSLGFKVWYCHSGCADLAYNRSL